MKNLILDNRSWTSNIHNHLLGSTHPTYVFIGVPAVHFEVQRIYDDHFKEIHNNAESFSFSTLCTCNCLLIKIRDSKGDKERHRDRGDVFLPSFLLKSLQFISLLCQGGLQVQVASIMGQLKGTVIRLDQKKTQSNINLSAVLWRSHVLLM